MSDEGRTLSPAPGAAAIHRMVAAQTVAELRTLLRNGEQLLLILVIPTLLLVLFTLVPVLDPGHGRRVDFLVPGVIALAVMSTAFTGQAIATGYERRYGVLKRLGATPLPRWGLLVAKTATVGCVEIGQIAVLSAVALALGWRPAGSLPALVLLLLVGTAAFSGLGLLMAGTLRAEVTLAAANLVYVIFLAVGGVVFPLSRFPEAVRPLLEALPIGALSGGLRDVLQHGAAAGLQPTAVLAAWTVVALAAAAATFRWE